METIPITIEVFIILVITGVIAGFIDSIAGGGGLITLPVLLSIGIPPQLAMGTNKLQGSFGTLSAAYNFIRKGEIKFRDAIPGIISTTIGAELGAWLIQQLDAGFLKQIIPFLLLSSERTPLILALK